MSALLAGIHLFPQNVEFVKRWANEIQDKLNASSPETHYHALILLREIRRQDKNALLKVLKAKIQKKIMLLDYLKSLQRRKVWKFGYCSACEIH